MLSTTSAHAPRSPALSREVSSAVRRSCANATVPDSTSQPVPCSTAPRPRHSICTKYRNWKAPFESEYDIAHLRDEPDRSKAAELVYLLISRESEEWN